MRRLWLIPAVIAVLLSFATLSLASAQTTTTTPTTTAPPSPSPSTFIVKKVVVGTPPPGAIFTVVSNCDPVGVISHPFIFTVVMSFDAAGTPVFSPQDPTPNPSGNQRSFDDPRGTYCEGVGEPNNGGASSVEFDCSLTYGPDDPQHLASCDRVPRAPDAPGLRMYLPGTGSDVATVTVTNSFPDPSPVIVSPNFTG